MYHFEYVSKKEAAPYKSQLIELLNRVQDYVRDEFTFQFTFIGSSSRNMITYDPTTNVGFDFDVNIAVNDDNEDYLCPLHRPISPLGGIDKPAAGVYNIEIF